MPEALVICWGNELRGDDGAGPAVGHALLEQAVPARIRLVHQLVPELAIDLAETTLAVFVDAARDLPPGEIRVDPIHAAEPTFRGTHRFGPAQLLGLVRAICDRCPTAWQVSIGGRDWDLRMSLSPAVAAAVRVAAGSIGRLIGSPTSRD